MTTPSPPFSTITQPLKRSDSSQTTAKNGNFSQAFSLFTQLSNSGHRPNEFTLSSLLKASSILSDSTLGQQLQANSIRSGLSLDPGIRSSLIAMYSSSGNLSSSRKVFDEMPAIENSDVPSWNSLISAYIDHGHYSESFNLLSNMIGINQLVPTVATYIIMIGSCAASKEIEVGSMLHARMIKERVVHEMNVSNSLITMYSKCGELRHARRVFDGMYEMNVVTWNAMIAGYEQNGEGEQALELFSWMKKSRVGVKPNRITFLSLLSAVSSVMDLRLGKQAHAQVVRLGLESETSVGNSLVTMYGKCGNKVKARLVFDRMQVRDVITWNSMLAGYAQNEKPESFFKLFREMQSMGFKPDDHTLTILLSSELSSCKLGREIHGYFLRRARSKTLQVSICNAIITMYAKKGRLQDAEKIFKGMDERDSYSWNSMMDAYSTNGCFHDAVEVFVDSLTRSSKFDHLTLSILLTASGKTVSIGLGKQFHAFTVKCQLHVCTSNASLLSINNALVSMYSKCGSITDAAKVFDRMTMKDIFSWTALITGYAHQGMACESLHLFERMRQRGVQPNSVTFLGLLTACAHAGLTEEGAHYFNMMSKVDGIEPGVDHYACMVDLFGRSGLFEIAKAMIATGIKQLKLKQGASLPLWKVLLGACHAHKQLELGQQAAARILEIEPEDETTHVLLSNLYASFSMWSEAIGIRKQMRDKKLKKEAGWSWVEVENKRHEFVAGDGYHTQRKEIYEKLRELDERCRGIGYIPMTELVLHDVDEAQKEAILNCHSEKLAVSYGVLRTGNALGVIRVIKNLRVCRDCHNWMKFASQVEGREIVLRDSKRFHWFKDGKCSCGDYW